MVFFKMNKKDKKGYRIVSLIIKFVVVSNVIINAHCIVVNANELDSVSVTSKIYEVLDIVFGGIKLSYSKKEPVGYKELSSDNDERSWLHEVFDTAFGGVINYNNRSKYKIVTEDMEQETQNVEDMELESNEVKEKSETSSKARIGSATEVSDNLKKVNWLDPLYNSTYSGSSGFGMRVHPVTGKWTFHRGLDMAAPAGEIIYASREGTVIKAESYGTYGNCVIIDHGDGYTSLYAHMSAIGVKKDDIVKQGAPIGKVGSTGRSTGPHLHFEIAYNAPGHTSAKAGVYPEGNYLNPKTTVKGIK